MMDITRIAVAHRQETIGLANVVLEVRDRGVVVTRQEPFSPGQKSQFVIA